MSSTSKSGLFTFGNHKLPTTTAIFNCGSATDCASFLRGLCKCRDICYALRAEERYARGLARPHREAQGLFWRNCTADEFVRVFLNDTRRRRIETTTLRFNEAGDIRDVDDMLKVFAIARQLPGVRIGLYTAARDVTKAFEGAMPTIWSPWRCAGPRPQNLQVVCSDGVGTHSSFVVRKGQPTPTEHRGSKVFECPGDCKACDVCYRSNSARVAVAFKEH